MSLRYKMDMLDALKSKGYTTYRLAVDKVFSSSSIQKLRTGVVLSADGINKLCELLQCQPGDILEYVEDEN